MTREEARDLYLKRMRHEDDEEEETPEEQPVQQPASPVPSNSGGQSGGSQGGNHPNTHLPYGLCKQNGIDVPEGTPPSGAWKLLEEGTGATHDEVMKHVSETGSVEGLKTNSGKPLGQRKPQQPAPTMTQGVMTENPALQEPTVTVENPPVAASTTTDFTPNTQVPQQQEPQQEPRQQSPDSPVSPQPKRSTERTSSGSRNLPIGQTTKENATKNTGAEMPKTPQEARGRIQAATLSAQKRTRAFAKDPFHAEPTDPNKEFDALQDYVSDQLKVAHANGSSKEEEYWTRQAKILDAAAKRDGFISKFAEKVNKPIAEASTAAKGCKVSAGGVAKLLAAVIATLMSPSLGKGLVNIMTYKQARPKTDKPLTDEMIDRTIEKLTKEKDKFEFEEKSGSLCFQAFNPETLEYDEESMNNAVNDMMNSEYAKKNPNQAAKLKDGVQKYYSGMGAIARYADKIQSDANMTDAQKQSQLKQLGKKCGEISNQMYKGEYKKYQNGTKSYRYNMAAALEQISKKYGGK